MTPKEALEKIEKRYPEFNITSMSEIEKGWVFTGVYKKNGMVPDGAFPGVSKKDGSFFPVTFLDVIGETDLLNNEEEMDLDEIRQR